MKDSPARQAFLKRWTGSSRPALIRIKSPPKLDLRYPFIPPTGTNGKGLDLVLLVHGAVPRGLPDQLRGDVCQEIIAGILAGDLTEADIPNQLRRYIRKVRVEQEADFAAVSLDAPRRDGRSWHDVLGAETLE